MSSENSFALEFVLVIKKLGDRLADSVPDHVSFGGPYKDLQVEMYTTGHGRSLHRLDAHYLSIMSVT